MKHARRLLPALGALGGVYAVAVRPRMIRSGAAEDEVGRPFPGADLIPEGERKATMSATIDAPPSEV